MRQFIGLDIGASKIEGMLFSGNFKIMKKIRISTNSDKGKEKVLRNIVDVVKKLYSKNVTAIGVGFPGNVSNGVLGFNPNISCLSNFDLQSFLGERYGSKCKIAVENDSNCFAVAEHKLGAGRDSENMVGVIIGTGVGGGIIINNSLYTGPLGGAGEVGHMVIDPSGWACGCGRVGDFESWCSGPNIVRRYTEKGGKMKNPETKKIFESDDAVAKEIIRETYKKIGIAFGNIINILNPEIIVVGGGVSNSLNFSRIMQEAKRNIYPSLRNSVKIVKGKFGDSSGVYGAAVLAGLNC